MDVKIQINDLETSEEEPFLDVTYQREPYSGIAVRDTEWGHSECSYLNGFGHGRCYSSYPNGQLKEEFFLERGKELESRIWYPDGMLKEYKRVAPTLHQIFHQDGTLLYERTVAYIKSWYTGGALKQETVYEPKSKTYYAPDGVWVLAHKADEKTGWFMMKRENLHFHDAYIRKHYIELLKEGDFYPYFTHWLPEPPHKSKLRKQRFFKWNRRTKISAVDPEVSEIVCDMIGEDNLNIKYDGINLAITYHVTSALPFLAQALSCDLIPPPILSVESYSEVKYGDTVAQRAQIAMEALRT